jgi:low affinity Fe/Cu permease
MPSQNREQPSLFDRFADWVASFTSRAWFFAACVALVLVWAPSFLILQSVDTWQLIINTATTIVTFLLVALLQNTQKRSDDAVQQKLNAIARYLADGDQADADELRAAVGLEHAERS